MSTVALHIGRLAKKVSHKENNLDIILYYKALGNAETSNKIIYKLWSIEKRYLENNGVFFKMAISFYA